MWTPQPGISSFESPGVALFGYTSTACLQRLSQCSGDLGAGLALIATPYLAQSGHLFQQSIEKAIKAVLLHAGEEPPRTHPLEELLDLFAGKYPSVGTRLVSRYRRLMERVTPFAVRYRYDDLEPNFSVADLRDFAAIAGTMRSAAWRFVESHVCSGPIAKTPYVSKWTVDAVEALARRFAKAVAWFPRAPDRTLMTWLLKFRHQGTDPQNCCMSGVKLGAESATSSSFAWLFGTRKLARWWLLADGRVIGLELKDPDIDEPAHYLVTPSGQPREVRKSGR